ncbi:hypothetical protein [Hymenobacter sp. DG01]|uniref:hypothetical protein n=1 Tax=Hymenobacter sp. DG01 TaxID=2584940 RepID=UPI0011245C22|nr:hypothetical protein [Hymenobacter sp. DG01]
MNESSFLNPEDRFADRIHFLDYPASAKQLVAAHLFATTGEYWHELKGHAFSFDSWLNALHKYNPQLVDGGLPFLLQADEGPLYDLLLAIEPIPVHGIVGADAPQYKVYDEEQTFAILRKKLKERWPEVRFCVWQDPDRIETNFYYVHCSSAPSFQELTDFTAHYLASDETVEECEARMDAGDEDVFDAPPALRIHIDENGNQEWVQYSLGLVEVFRVNEQGVTTERNGRIATYSQKLPAVVKKALKL